MWPTQLNAYHDYYSNLIYQLEGDVTCTQYNFKQNSISCYRLYINQTKVAARITYTTVIFGGV
jgi:hypothetical protein